MSSLIDLVEQSQLRQEALPFFPVGATIRVNYRIVDNAKTRIQAFEGVVIGKHRKEKNNKASFTVRKVTQGYGVERTFPYHSPNIESIKVLKIGQVRRAKLYYLRQRRGKAARIREKIGAL